VPGHAGWFDRLHLWLRRGAIYLYALLEREQLTVSGER
jgi:hypothetical protein